jgi:hypothetical protein
LLKDRHPGAGASMPPALMLHRPAEFSHSRISRGRTWLSMDPGLRRDDGFSGNCWPTLCGDIAFFFRPFAKPQQYKECTNSFRNELNSLFKDKNSVVFGHHFEQKKKFPVLNQFPYGNLD